MSGTDVLAIPLEGTRLVEASAGTGKTFTIALLYLRLVIERGLGADQILVVTYTNAAAAELRERIRARLQEAASALETTLSTGAVEARGPRSRIVEMVEASISRGTVGRDLERLRTALRGFDESAIATIHGFCGRVLDENAFESGVAFGTELVPDQRALVDDVIADFWTRSFYAAEPEWIDWVRSTSRAGQRRTPGLLAMLAHTVAGQPGIRVIPERAPDRADCPLEARAEALAEVRRLWEQEGRETLERLARAAEKGVLNKNSFRPDAVRGAWGDDIASWLARPVVGGASLEPGKGDRVKASGIARISATFVAQGTRTGQTPPTAPLLEAVDDLSALDARCRDGFEARWLALELELIEYVRAELVRRRRRTRTRSYDDLLTALADALDSATGDALAERIRERFPAALIDEFQDTDPVQYTIFRRVWHGAEGPFFLIGDPKQAIYGFRGADVFAYMRARADAGADVVGLDVNWRSDPSVVGAVNAVFSRVATPFLYTGIPFAPAQASPLAKERLDAEPRGVGLRILFAERAPGTHTSAKGDPLLIKKGEAKVRVASAVAGDVAALLSSGARIGGEALDASRIAVLCRTNEQVRTMQAQLARFGVPSVIQTQESVFETDEAEILERVLAAAAEPTNVRALRAAITTPLVGVDATALRAIDADPEGLDPWLEQADAWHARWRTSGTLALVESILHAPGARERILGEAGGERRTTNWLHLAELMESAARTGPRTPPALVRWLVRMRRDARARAEQAGDDALVRLESDARAVQLVTVHRSKGLQYGLVYCPFLWDDRLLAQADEAWPRFHDPAADGRMTLDVGSAQHAESVERARHEAFAETVRLLYVALTRAEHRVVVAWGAFRGAETSALGCLLHPPPGLADRVGDADPTLVEACKEHWKKSLDDAAMRADLDRLVAGSGGTIRVEPLPEDVAPPAAQPRVERVDGRARTLPAPVLQQRRTSSFTGLVASGPEAAAPDPVAPVGAGDDRLGDDHPAAAGRDYDAALGAQEPAPEPGGEPGDEAGRVVLHDFPAGAGPGTLIHHVLEHLDFTDRSEAAVSRGVADGLARFAMPGALGPTLATGLRLALEAPLGGALGDFRLVDLARSARIDEMEFVLPVALDGGSPLDPARLGDAFARHGASPAVRRYAERAAALGFAGLAGHLRGFVDLVFRHDGRYYLADYKSNRLGSFAADYAPARLVDEMIRHDYVLQYHVYAVALHRFLAARVPGYDYARDFGGVYYLFVRGMAPDAPPGTGIFHDRPPEPLIEALTEALGEGPLDAERAPIGARP